MRSKVVLFSAIFLMGACFGHSSDCVLSKKASRGALVEYKKKVLALRNVVGQARKLVSALRSMESAIDKRFKKVERIDAAAGKGGVHDQLYELEMQKFQILRKIKMAVIEQQRLEDHLEHMVEKAKDLRLSLDELEEDLEGSFEDQVRISPCDRPVHVHRERPRIRVFSARMRNPRNAMVQMQNDFAQSMEAMREAMALGAAAAQESASNPASGMIIMSGSSSPGSNFAGKSFSSSTVEQRSFGPGGKKGSRQVKKSWSSIVDGQKQSGSVSGSAQLDPESGQWKFELEKVQTSPEGEKTRSMQSGKALDLDEFSRMLSE